MRFLADESCDFAVIRALRMAGYNVDAVSDVASGVEDEEVIRLATRGNRVLLTEDKDFGQLVYAHSQQSRGVIFLRYPATARLQLAKDVVRLVQNREEGLVGRFVVVQPGRVRISRIP